MPELGVLDRLSATACSPAVMVRRRARNDTRYSSENGILRLAENEPSSWSASVLRKELRLGLPVLGIDTSVLSVKQNKAKLHYHAVTVVLPAGKLALLFKKHPALVRLLEAELDSASVGRARDLHLRCPSLGSA